MSKYLVIIIILFAIPGCSVHRERNISRTIDYYGVDLYNFERKTLEDSFPQIADKSIVYKDTYIGNFTLHYSPHIINEDLVMAPKITCYSAELDFPEIEYEKHRNHVRCRYSEAKNYYAVNPLHYFKIDGSIPLDIAKKIAVSWYKNKEKWEYIDYIVGDHGNFRIDYSGNACSGSYDVLVSGNDGTFEFRKNEIQICS